MTIKDLQKKMVCLVSLGCDKNRVDSERMLYVLNKFGFDMVSQPDLANIIIINTCAFIESARQESIDKIIEMLPYKKQNLDKLIVVGCLPAKFKDELQKALPEVDVCLGVNCEDELIDAILTSYGITTKTNPCNEICPRVLSTPSHYAYLKIADGCNNKCSYCTIPKIRGPYKSVEMEKLVAEAKLLASKGVKELILVAQDVTRYGEDIYKKHMLVPLIQELSKIDGIQWIRLHYCYPEFVKDDLIDEIANNKKVCKYMDIPIQHVDDTLLHQMNRASNYNGITSLINKLREKCPDIAIRTSMIVGFPGEGHDAFIKVKQFLLDYKLDNVGFFEYSREADTESYNFVPSVPSIVKKKRLKKLVDIQTKIMYEKLYSKINKTIRAICDDETEQYYILRSEYDSPEIDSIIYINKNKKLQIGNIYNVKVINVVEPFDLEGEII